jgi:hypothetical protein
MSANPSSPPSGREPATVRIAMWSARHRWPVAATWFLATIGIFAVSLALGGINAADANANPNERKIEASVAYDVFNAGGTNDPFEQVLVLEHLDVGPADDPQSGALIASAEHLAGVVHREIAIAALESGKHVISEKPTAMNAAEAEELVAAAKRHPSQIAIIDDQGELTLSKRISTGREGFTELLGDPDATHVALEATYGWEWLAELLEDAGFDVHLAHPLRTRAIAAARFRLWKLMGDRLTDTQGISSPALRHSAICRPASRTDHSPICSINPQSSASGMNIAGDTWPRSGSCQRASASTPWMPPSPVRICG